MPAPEPAWPTIPLSTTVELAVASYRRGIAALVAGATHGVPALEAAVAADPEFQLARVGLAAALVARGEPFVRPADRGSMSTAERHHLEIVDAICRGDEARATDLRREHLLEYPADLLVVWAPQLRSGS